MELATEQRQKWSACLKDEIAKLLKKYGEGNLSSVPEENYAELTAITSEELKQNEALEQAYLALVEKMKALRTLPTLVYYKDELNRLVGCKVVGIQQDKQELAQ